ncbi:PREDICTED: caspase-1-like [Vollenhovia emeryi]|uniref:caspase-1-like n=1 Tax=Vollenhovia emeryi TaxID=411798 RepID=UPI0005F374CD|nr:PREDICTED: caspase-1-like [Vollenhovia emeryi]
MICAKNAIYQVDVLWKPFTADKCTSLAGKPKLFFIQACRGEAADSGIKISPRTLRQTETDTVPYYTIPTHADFLMAYSSRQGECL